MLLANKILQSPAHIHTTHIMPAINLWPATTLERGEWNVNHKNCTHSWQICKLIFQSVQFTCSFFSTTLSQVCLMAETEKKLGYSTNGWILIFTIFCAQTGCWPWCMLWIVWPPWSVKIEITLLPYAVLKQFPFPFIVHNAIEAWSHK